MIPPRSGLAAPAPDAGAIGRRCVVTGGTGYLGRSLAARLRAAGHEVSTLDVRPAPDGTAPTHRVDLRDHDATAAALAGADCVFHTAAVISTVGEDLAAPRLRRLAYGVNVVGTENVVRACVRNGVKKLVHVSSFNVCMAGPVDGGDESLPYARSENALYTRTKIAAEECVLAADGRAGLRTVALRPGGIWGEGRGGMMLDAFVEQLALGRFTARIETGGRPLDNVHVENLVDALVLAAAALGTGRADGRAFFVTDDERFDGMEWFRPVVEGLGHRFPTLAVPSALMLRVAHGLELAHALSAPEPTITRRGIRNLAEGGHFRIDAARARLGYVPRYRREDLESLLPELQAYATTIRSRTP